MSTENLYRFYHSSRLVSLEGVFTEYAEVMAAMQDVEVCFIGALGKHSVVYVTISEENVKLLSSDPIVVGTFRDHVGVVGHDPVEVYLEYHADDAPDERTEEYEKVLALVNELHPPEIEE